MKIVEIEGIGNSYAEKLHAAGIRTVGALLKAGATAKGREELAESSGISSKLILEWVNRADLMRVRGVGKQYSDLLERVGVDSVKELRHRRPDHLHKTMVALNAEKHFVRRPPALVEVESWVKDATRIVPVVTY